MSDEIRQEAEYVLREEQFDAHEYVEPMVYIR